MSRVHPSSIRNTASILDRKKSFLAGDCFAPKNVVPDDEGSPISNVPFEVARKDRVFDSSRRSIQSLIENDMLPQNPRYTNFLPKSVFLAPGEVLDDSLVYDKDPAARLTFEDGYISPRSLAQRKIQRTAQNPYKGCNLKYKFVDPSGTQLSMPTAMVNSERCELVISEVQSHTTLERIDASDNHFDDFSGSNLVDALCNSENVHAISMSRNGCGGPTTCRAFGRILATHTLTSLMLCGMTSPILDDQGPSIVQGIRFCRSLCVLDLSANMIGDITMFEFERASLDHPKLRFVNFEGNLITDQGSYSLSKVSRQFQSLNISHNKIGASGIAAVLASLSQANCRLESLYVHRNYFEDSSSGNGEGSMGIALNTTLRTLNLSFMRMEDASSLGAGLIMNKFLVEIDLSQNELQDNAVHFMTNIASNQGIEFIDFSSNRIGTRGTLWILSGLAEKLRRQSNKLIQVRLLNNFYNPSLEQIIHDVNNKHLSAAIRIQRAESAINNFERDQRAKWKAMDTHLFDMRVLLAYEFAAERLALRTPAEVATDIIPDRPLICKFPVIRHYFIFREWLETGISPSWRLQEELCARIPEAEKKALRVALGLEQDEEEENEDPFAPKNRNILKEQWDEFLGAIYSWFYSVSGATAPAAGRNTNDDD